MLARFRLLARRLLSRLALSGSSGAQAGLDGDDLRFGDDDAGGVDLEVVLRRSTDERRERESRALRKAPGTCYRRASTTGEEHALCRFLEPWSGTRLRLPRASETFTRTVQMQATYAMAAATFTYLLTRARWEGAVLLGQIVEAEAAALWRGQIRVRRDGPPVTPQAEGGRWRSRFRPSTSSPPTREVRRGARCPSRRAGSRSVVGDPPRDGEPWC